MQTDEGRDLLRDRRGGGFFRGWIGGEFFTRLLEGVGVLLHFVLKFYAGEFGEGFAGADGAAEAKGFVAVEDFGAEFEEGAVATAQVGEGAVGFDGLLLQDGDAVGAFGGETAGLVGGVAGEFECVGEAGVFGVLSGEFAADVGELGARGGAVGGRLFLEGLEAFLERGKIIPRLVALGLSDGEVALGGAELEGGGAQGFAKLAGGIDGGLGEEVGGADEGGESEGGAGEGEEGGHGSGSGPGSELAVDIELEEVVAEGGARDLGGA